MMTLDAFPVIWNILLKYKDCGISLFSLRLKVKHYTGQRLDDCFSDAMALEGYLVSEENHLLFPCRDPNGDYVEGVILKLFEVD